MSRKVVIYSSDTCVYCSEVKKYLRGLNVSFTEKNVSTDVEARKDMMKKGFMGVPIVFIDNHVVQGFDKEKIDQLLK
ncbi:MAG: NrdH-redoxin [Alkaliphilus sp.]|nr:MAG: NrdH-redoxin [Alkaliphilus sp.]